MLHLNTSKKRNSSSRKEPKIKIALLILIIFLFVTSTIIGVNYKKKRNNQEEDTKYFTGSLYSANTSANLIDYIDYNSNIVISPFNINSSLAYLYNGTDNNSSKEIKNYFKNNNNELNEEMNIKFQKQNSSSFLNENYKKIYETYIGEFKIKKYDELNINKIGFLNNSEKNDL